MALLLATGTALLGCGRPSSEADVQEAPASGTMASADPAEAPDSAPAPDVAGFPEAATGLGAMFSSGQVASVRLIGDSITAGYGTDGWENPDDAGVGTVIFDDGAGTVHYESTPAANSWANAFRAYASDHGCLQFVNAGICGEFMETFGQNPDAWMGDGADVIFVALGTNDAGYYGPGEFEEAARAGLAAASQRCKVLVVVSPVSDLRPESMLVEPAASLGDVLRPICEENGYLFVDARDAVAPEQFCDDGLHPNSEGSLALWDCIRTTLGL